MKNRQSLIAIVFVLAVLVFSPVTASAKDEWLQVRSKNFNLIGNASEKDIRKVATKLEQFREAFRLIFTRVNFNSMIPTNVVVFKSDGAYKPFKPKRADGKIDNFVAGYFQPGEDVNYITVSTEGEDAQTFGTIFHEYVHFIVETNFGKSDVPPWFNEGLAEYYQTFAMEDDQKAKLGLPQTEHLYLLQRTKLIPLDTLFKISNYALHQNGSHSRSIFYAQSWALVHYLQQSGKPEGLGKFLSLLLKTVPAEKAFQDTFQMTYAEMEKELRKYVEQNSYKYWTFSFKNKLVFDAEMQVAPISEALTNAYLGDLLYHINRADDAEPFLQKAVAVEPEMSMANTTLAMVKLRQRKYAEAKNYLEKALAKDPKNHLAFYQYAYLLSREDRDEFGYVSKFSPEKSAKMREMLKKAIAVNPAFTESYELLAFVNLVNNEQLDEAVAFLRKALQYQPGNQQYQLRIAEIYFRQEKFDEASAIADKIAKTADEPETKAQAERLSAQVKQYREVLARNEAARKEYEAAVAEARKNGAQPVLNRRGDGETSVSKEELDRLHEENTLHWVNSSLRKPAPGEKQILGRIQKIECKDKILYTIKTDAEVVTLTSKDFQNLESSSFVGDSEGVQIGCGTNVADFLLVLTYKPLANAKSPVRGELIALEFVPRNFRFLTEQDIAKKKAENEIAEKRGAENASAPPPPKAEDFEAERRAAMMDAIKNALRPAAAGEKREIGFIEKSECGGKGMFFFIKTQTQIFKLAATNPQSIQLRAFTPETENLRFGCDMKQIEIPVVFTFKVVENPKTKSQGEIVALEFVPKNFVLDK